MSAAGGEDTSAILDPAAAEAAHAAPTTVPPFRAGGLKLRDCCQTCAKSKVRCTKEKPTCSRCEARGTVCRYLQCKRPGRIPGSGARRLTLDHGSERPTTPRSSRSSAGADAGGSLPSPPRRHSSIGEPSTQPAGAATDIVAAFLSSPPKADSLFGASCGASDTSFLNATPDLHVNGDQNVQFDWDDCLDVLSTIDDNMYTDLMDWDTNMANMDSHLLFDGVDGHGVGVGVGVGVAMGATGYNSTLEPSKVCALPGPPHLPAPSALSSLAPSSTSSSSSPALNLLDLSNSTASPSLSTSDRLQSTFNLPGASGANGPESSATSNCDCMTRALDLLKALSNDQLPVNMPASGSSFTETILAKNKEDIKATLAILACTSCSNDRFLLMISLLITMKILPRYASAAALPSSTAENAGHFIEKSHSSGEIGDLSPTSGRGTDAQSSPRQAIQQVLRELHLVQRLIAQLSLRLKGLASHGADTGSATGLFESQSVPVRSKNSSTQKSMMRNTSFTSSIGVTETVPLSARTLDLVEDDVRRSLSALSAVVRGALKNS